MDFCLGCECCQNTLEKHCVLNDYITNNVYEETLKSFDTLNYFLKTNMTGRIPVTKSNFEEQKSIIKGCIDKINE